MVSGRYAFATSYVVARVPVDGVYAYVVSVAGTTSVAPSVDSVSATHDAR